MLVVCSWTPASYLDGFLAFASLQVFELYIQRTGVEWLL